MVSLPVLKRALVRLGESQLTTRVFGKSLQSCLTLCNSIDCNPPGSSVHGILQARILEGVAMSSSRGSFQLRDQTRVSYASCIGRWVLYHECHLGSLITSLWCPPGLCLSLKPCLLCVWLLKNKPWTLCFPSRPVSEKRGQKERTENVSEEKKKKNLSEQHRLSPTTVAWESCMECLLDPEVAHVASPFSLPWLRTAVRCPGSSCRVSHQVMLQTHLPEGRCNNIMKRIRSK